MKLVLASSGYPLVEPGRASGDAPSRVDLEVRRLAQALAARGHAVLVAAGVVAAGARSASPHSRVSEAADGAVRVLEIERADLCNEHWQKSSSPAAVRLFRGLVASERPDVVHVHHWKRLSRELVHACALERVPAVVTLHDAWTHCVLGTRVLPATGAACEAPAGLSPCVACASRVAPRTPWVPREAQYVAFAERERDLGRELALARVVTVPSAAHVRALQSYLPAHFGIAAKVEVAEPPRDEGDVAASAEAAWVDAWEARYARARAAGAPEVSAPRDDWYSERVREFALEQWDRSYRSTPRAELGGETA